MKEEKEIKNRPLQISQHITDREVFFKYWPLMTGTQCHYSISSKKGWLYGELCFTDFSICLMLIERKLEELLMYRQKKEISLHDFTTAEKERFLQE